MEGFVAPYILVLALLLILFPGLPVVAVVLLFVTRYRAIPRNMALVGAVSFVLVILANMLNWILLMYVLPPIIGMVHAGGDLWFFLFGVGPCLWSVLAVFIGALLGTRLGRRFGRKTAN